MEFTIKLAHLNIFLAVFLVYFCTHLVKGIYHLEKGNDDFMWGNFIGALLNGFLIVTIIYGLFLKDLGV